MSHPFPPEYETLVSHSIPSAPDYSQNPDETEILVEASIPSPPYIQRALSRESTLSSSSNRNSQYPNSLAGNSSINSNSGGSGSSGASNRHRHSDASSLSYAPGNNVIASSPYAPVNPANVELLAGTEVDERFVYSSGNIELDLGVRPEGLQHPSYGRNAIIRGEVRMKKMSSVKSISVVLEGRVQTVITQAGLPQGHNALKVLELTQNVFNINEPDKSQGQSKGKGKDPNLKAFPFEFELPSNIEGTNDPLPPTFRGYFHAMEGWVRYTLKVVANKTGLWPREALLTTIHYLPKSYLRPEALLWPEISLMDAKRFGFQCEKWRTTQAHLTPSAATTFTQFPHLLETPSSLPELSISIARTAQAVATVCFPLNVTIRVPGGSHELLDLYVKKTTIQLIKVVTLNAANSKSAHGASLGRGRIQQIEKELVSEDTRIIRGGVNGGVREGEASWSVGNIIDVQYFVRVSISPEDSRPPIFRHDEPIEMFTHSREQYECPFEIHDAPATGILLGSSLHNNTPTFR